MGLDLDRSRSTVLAGFTALPRLPRGADEEGLPAGGPLTDPGLRRAFRVGACSFVTTWRRRAAAWRLLDVDRRGAPGPGAGPEPGGELRIDGRLTRSRWSRRSGCRAAWRRGRASAGRGPTGCTGWLPGDEIAGTPAAGSAGQDPRASRPGHALADGRVRWLPAVAGRCGRGRPVPRWWWRRAGPCHRA